jgi:hypothetical protein
MAAETQERAESTKHQLIEVRLEDGQTITAELGNDEAAARSELASLHAFLDPEAFVFLGGTALVRSRDVKYVLFHEKEEPSGSLLDSLKTRVTGGNDMTSYDTEQTRPPTARVRREDDGPGFADQWVGYGRRPWSETKPFFMTSEFLTFVGAVAAVAIAMATSDILDADRGWLLITILAVAYMVSRGIAKSGTRDPNPRDQ